MQKILIKKRATMLVQTILTIQTHSLSVQIRWMMFMRMLMITTQAEKEKLSLSLMT